MINGNKLKLMSRVLLEIRDSDWFFHGFLLFFLILSLQVDYLPLFSMSE